MNHKNLQSSHIHIASFKGDIQSKLNELDKLIEVVGNSPKPLEASGQEMPLLSKLRNMLTVLNLHTTSILNDLAELRIADSAYRENSHTTEITSFIEKIMTVVAPHSDMIYTQTMSAVSETYKQQLKSLEAAKALENDSSNDNLFNNPLYMNLNRH